MDDKIIEELVGEMNKMNHSIGVLQAKVDDLRTAFKKLQKIVQEK